MSDGEPKFCTNCIEKLTRVTTSGYARMETIGEPFVINHCMSKGNCDHIRQLTAKLDERNQAIALLIKTVGEQDAKLDEAKKESWNAAIKKAVETTCKFCGVKNSCKLGVCSNTIAILQLKKE